MDDLVQELKVSIVARTADDGTVVDLEDSWQLSDMCQRAVGAEQISAENDAIVELDADYGGTGQNWTTVKTKNTSSSLSLSTNSGSRGKKVNE